MIEFSKMHGAGNDFVVVGDLDNRLINSPEVAKRLCDRRFGVGADGLIRIGRGRHGDVFMDYRNSDGSFAEMCGNGTRVVGKWLGDRDPSLEIVKLETGDGVKELRLFRSDSGVVTHVGVDMGMPQYPETDYETISVDTAVVEYSFVSMGNPHAVVFVDEVDGYSLERLARCLQSDVERFPASVNVEIVEIVDRARLKQRTFERGAGETLACGTGACAVTVAARRRDFCDTCIDIELLGGTLEMNWEHGETVAMKGPAVEVFRGQLSEALFDV